ncbi:MAG TPA: 5-deoxy-glucuronate isomerase [Acidothermaceae bacterium]|jgi:5-deoxy-glucuronate isomerase
MRTLITPGKDTDLIKLEVADLEADESLQFVADGEALVVILSGVLDVEVDGAQLGRAGGRASVFDGGGDAVYLPPGAAVKLTEADDGSAAIAVASAPLADEPAANARIITPADHRVVHVGDGNWARQVRTILGPEHAAGRLLVGETVNPPGNWSSYPPHKHDEDNPPHEVQLEEVYYFKFDPPGGFGVQLRYDGKSDPADEVFVVRDGDVAIIKSGYHPVVGAPGYSFYYLWVMAGRGRQMAPALDPRHAWVQQSVGRANQPASPVAP